MGTIQQSINSMIGTTTQGVGIAKGITELKKKNELELASAKADIVEGLGNIDKSEIEMKKDESLSKGALKEAKGELKSIDQQRAFNSSPKLLEKRAEAARNVEEQKQAIALQRKEFAARRQALQAQKETLEGKAKVYGIDINELTKGGKK